MSESVIKPTVGRIVHFWPDKAEGEPRPAIIAKVHDDRRVNLAVVNEDGTVNGCGGKRGVLLLQPGDERPVGFFAEWPQFIPSTPGIWSGVQQRLDDLEEKVSDCRERLDEIDALDATDITYEPVAPEELAAKERTMEEVAA